MADTRRKKHKESRAVDGLLPDPEVTTGSTIPFDTEILSKIRGLPASGLNPGSALDLIGLLMAEVPSASKDTMEKIKMIDSLIKTSRSMMEIKLKNDEVLAITNRLDELEAQLEKIAETDTRCGQRPAEIWKRPDG